MLIYIPTKRKIVTVEQPIVTGHNRLKAEVRLKLLDINGNLKHDTGWFPNLITNRGLIQMGFGTSASYWANNLLIGSNNTAPAFTDNSLYGYLAEAALGQESAQVPVGPNWELSNIFKARFNAGVGTGTIRELGAQYSGEANNNNISTRAIVSPDVVKAADQILDVYYRFYRYPDLVDRTGVIDISGTNYNYIVRGAHFSDYGGLGSYNLHLANGPLGVNTSYSVTIATSNEITTYDTGPSGGITDPWCTSCWFISASGSSVTPYNDWGWNWAIDRALGNIRVIKWRERGHNSSAQRGWQMRLGKVSDDSALTKDNTMEMNMTARVSWGRYP